MNTLVLATGNPHKVVEIQPLLQKMGFEVRLQSEFFSEQVEEDGLSFLENALKKARYASLKTGLPAIADDSGIEVEAINGQPGIYSARYGEGYQGQPASDELNNIKLLSELKGLPFSQRKANYFCAMVYIRYAEDPKPIIGFGRWDGEILTEVKTPYGIGYDPIMWMPQHLKVASDIPLEIKNQISHRAQAFNEVIKELLNN